VVKVSRRRAQRDVRCYSIFCFGMVTTFATTIGNAWRCTLSPRLFQHAFALPLGGHPCCGPCSCAAAGTLWDPRYVQQSTIVLKHIARFAHALVWFSLLALVTAMSHQTATLEIRWGSP